VKSKSVKTLFNNSIEKEINKNLDNFPYISILNYIKVVISGTSRTRVARYNFLDIRMLHLTHNRPTNLICHLISCPVFPAALSIPFS
jgi:hypothetical protein